MNNKSIIKLIKDNYEHKELTQVFNDSFSDYVHPLVVTETSLSQKISGDDISMEYSIGLFNEDTNSLEGFMLHAPDNHEKPTQLYNSATGVKPNYRGKSVERMYKSMIPYYIEKGIKSIVLEVVSINDRAVKVYERCGFIYQRVFNLYKGEINKDNLLSLCSPQPTSTSTSSNNNDNQNTIKYNKVIEFNQELFDIMDFDKNSKTEERMKPSWSNSALACKREFEIGINKIWTATIFDKEIGKQVIIGYVSVYSTSFRIRQIYVSPKYRNQNIATNLILQMSNDFDSNVCFNFGIDSRFENLINFFTKRIGFKYFIACNEMLLDPIKNF